MKRARKAKSGVKHRIQKSQKKESLTQLKGPGRRSVRLVVMVPRAPTLDSWMVADTAEGQKYAIRPEMHSTMPENAAPYIVIGLDIVGTRIIT